MRFFAAFLVLMFCCTAAAGEEREYMRVVANSDSPYDQREKMLVRNAALLLYPDRLAWLEVLFPNCRVERKIWQPDQKTTPAGTVYITIGQGRGQNWWGVLFPESVQFACRGEGQVQLRFPFFEWLFSLFKG